MRSVQVAGTKVLGRRGGFAGRFAVLSLFVLAGFLGAAGCCSSKTQECNKLITVMNKNGETIKAATAKMNSSKGDTAAIEEVATAMESAADDIKTVESKDEELQKLAKEYDEMLRNGAKAARDMVKARKDNDVGGQNKAIGELGIAETTEVSIVDKVNKYCAK